MTEEILEKKFWGTGEKKEVNQGHLEQAIKKINKSILGGYSLVSLGVELNQSTKDKLKKLLKEKGHNIKIRDTEGGSFGGYGSADDPDETIVEFI